MPDSDPRTPLTLEDLLRLKRAERPSPEFWTRFERELRQKQLAALMERRPWWQTFPQFLTQRRTILPLGATAIIAFALVSSRFYAPVQFAQADSLASSDRASSPVSFSASVTTAPTLEESVATIVPVVAADPKSYENNSVAAVVPLSEHLPEHAVELTPWSAPLPVQSLSAKLVVSNVEPLMQDSRGLTQPLVSSPMPITTSRLERSGGAVAELASVSALASKRTRLLAQFNDRQFTPEPQAPANIRERLTRHLSDASFGERFSRVGLKGDQVSLRF